MKTTIAFDVYGTLIDTNGVLIELQKLVGDQASLFAQSWRDKQLEYSFRRGLMRRYKNFSVCTSQALDYTSHLLNVELSDSQKQTLLSIYTKLPAFSDVASSLKKLKEKNVALYAFSNGTAEAVEGLLSSANIKHHFDGVVSADSVKTFKPDPIVYQHFLTATNTIAGEVVLVSSNPFDVLGAINVGMQAAWIRRSTASHFDPWDIQPTFILSSLLELEEKIIS